MGLSSFVDLLVRFSTVRNSTNRDRNQNKLKEKKLKPQKKQKVKKIDCFLNQFTQVRYFYRVLLNEVSSNSNEKKMFEC